MPKEFNRVNLLQTVRIFNYRNFPFEIINADLFSIYEGLDIGTAKPGQEFLKTIKHYLIDTIKPNMKYTFLNSA